ncbi:MAG: family 16 glycoside hydrolase, partial [Candidatus Latescibacterota bacterium]|nr:family 16 glycoside hydrolase [Candidatus Latescibacterota bacterium]
MPPAIAAVGLTSLMRGRRPLLLFLCGSAPLLLAWGLYIAVDVDTFVAQMQLQLERKAGSAQSPLGNLLRLARFSGRAAPLMLASFLGGMAGLIAGRRELLPWLIGAVCLVPVILLSGELIYPAYMAPFTAVGLGWWLRLSRWASRALLAAVLGFGVTLALDPPPLAGIDPKYEPYCSNLSNQIGPGHTVLFAIVPDPWFCLRKRSDLQIRIAPPVHLTREKMRTYLAKADDVVLGGYNPPGFDDVVREWDNWATPGQRLWIVNGEVYSFAEYREHLRLSSILPSEGEEHGRQNYMTKTIELFNGRDLAGWEDHKNPHLWTVVDGMIVGTSEAGKMSNLSTQTQYGDFELTFEYNADAKVNSGVFLRVSDLDDEVHTGLEIQILDTYGKEPPLDNGDSGALYDMIAPSTNPLSPAGEWNRMRLRC